MEPVREKTFFVKGEFVTAGLIILLIVVVFGGGIFLFKNIQTPSSQDQIPQPSTANVLAAEATPQPLEQLPNPVPAGPQTPTTTPKPSKTASPTPSPSTSVSPSPSASPTDSPSTSPTASPSSSGTDTSAPTIESINVSDNQTDVATDIKIKVTFNEEMDSSTINGNLELKDSSNTVNSSVSYENSTHIATLSPNISLDPNKSYTFTVKTGVKDKAGNQLVAEKVIQFKTTGSSSPSPSP